MAKKKTTGGISLSEFRAWLQGVEEMQGPDWAPTSEQWKRIKAKFEDVVEEEPVVETAAPHRGAQVFGQGRTAYPPQPQAQPQVATTLPSYTPAPPQAPAVMGINGGRTKTPDIDSSNGYSSDLV